MMELVRELFFISASNSFEWRSIHLSSKENNCADALSRGDIKGFLNLAPNMDSCMTNPQIINGVL